MKENVFANYQRELRESIAHALILDWFERYLNHQRGLGNTRTLLAACEAAAATLVCHNPERAEAIAQQHKIQTTFVGNAAFAQAPAKSVVDNEAIFGLVRAYARTNMLAERLLSYMQSKGMHL